MIWPNGIWWFTLVLRLMPGAPEIAVAPPKVSGPEYRINLKLDAKGQLTSPKNTFVLDTPQKLKVHLMREKESLERAALAKGQKGEINIVIILHADKDCKYSDTYTAVHSCQLAGFKKYQVRILQAPAK